jgi:hypothetical protein
MNKLAFSTICRNCNYPLDVCECTDIVSSNIATIARLDVIQAVQAANLQATAVHKHKPQAFAESLTLNQFRHAYTTMVTTSITGVITAEQVEKFIQTYYPHIAVECREHVAKVTEGMSLAPVTTYVPEPAEQDEVESDFATKIKAYLVRLDQASL